MCLLSWLDRLPSNKSLTPFLLIPPNSQHLLFQFFRIHATNIYGPATLAGQGSCLLYLSNPAKSPHSQHPPFLILFENDFPVDNGVCDLCSKNLCLRDLQ